MTYKERAVKEYGEERAKIMVKYQCPKMFNYTKEDKCPEEYGKEYTDTEWICKKCWEREMPDQEKSYMDIFLEGKRAGKAEILRKMMSVIQEEMEHEKAE